MFLEETLLLYQPFGAKIVSSHRRRAMQTKTSAMSMNKKPPAMLINNCFLLLLVYIYNRQAEKYALTER